METKKENKFSEVAKTVFVRRTIEIKFKTIDLQES